MRRFGAEHKAGGNPARYRYYGIYGNWISLKKFYSYVKWELYKTKRRRDQSCWLTWQKFKEILRIYPLEWPHVYLKSAY